MGNLYTTVIKIEDQTFAFSAKSEVANSSGSLLNISFIFCCKSGLRSVKKKTNNGLSDMIGCWAINDSHLNKARLLDSKKWASDTIFFGGSLGINLKYETYYKLN